VAAGAGHLPDPMLLALFGTGAFVMRGAGCTINDVWDADLDRQVARTQSRPLAAGHLTTTQATTFLAAQLTAGLGVLLSLPHTWYCFQWGCASLPLVALYPATKRFFAYPQVVLGLTFNWGAIMGWAAVHGSIDWSIVGPLYGSGVTWTILYDTLYAHQDKRDDAKLQLHSTALTFGTNDDDQRKILHGLAAATWMQWLWVGYAADLAYIPYGLGATAAFGHLVWQVQTADFNNPHNLALRFRSNNTTGGILFVALTLGTYLASTS
jgi:4-hydroxybenzoate polyprenyltransferase